MAINVYPRNLLVTAVFLGVFGSLLSVAADLRRGVAVGVLAIVAYLLIEGFVAFNPAVWWRERHGQRRRG